MEGQGKILQSKETGNMECYKGVVTRQERGKPLELKKQHCAKPRGCTVDAHQ
jgi:hypothetical protein